MIIWLMGPVGAGKSTIARELQQWHGGVIIDGDEWIEVMAPARVGKAPKHSHTPAAKRLSIANNERIARMALVLSRQMTVYVAVVAPNDGVRRAVTAVCNPFWVWVDRPGDPGVVGAWQDPDDVECIVGGGGELVGDSAARVALAAGL